METLRTLPSWIDEQLKEEALNEAYKALEPTVMKPGDSWYSLSDRFADIMDERDRLLALKREEAAIELGYYLERQPTPLVDDLW